MELYNIKLNSFIFMWDKLLLVLPVAFFVVLALNFGIYSLVFWGSMVCFKIENKKQIYIRYIFRIFGVGLFVDCLVLIIMIFLSDYDIIYEVEEALVTVPVFTLSAFVGLAFNYFLTFRTLRNEASRNGFQNSENYFVTFGSAPDDALQNKIKLFKSNYITFKDTQKEATKNELKNSENGYKKLRIVFSCIFAVATSPWSFVLPFECTEWFYLLLIKYFNFW